MSVVEQWATEHWFLTFLLVYCAVHTIFLIINRLLRTIKVLGRGWPPEHLDADGDWRPEKEEK